MKKLFFKSGLQFDLQLIVFLVALFCVISACKTDSKEKNIQPESEVNAKTADTSSKVANLENIPFEMPQDWVYKTISNEVKKSMGNEESGFMAIAHNPSNVNVTVTVWEYSVDSLEELLPLFVMDMNSLNLSVTYEVKDGIVHGLTKDASKPEPFKWKAKNFKKDGKLMFVAVGARNSLYQVNDALIDRIFDSIGY